jgi:hypothetical protein
MWDFLPASASIDSLQNQKQCEAIVQIPKSPNPALTHHIIRNCHMSRCYTAIIELSRLVVYCCIPAVVWGAQRGAVKRLSGITIVLYIIILTEPVPTASEGRAAVAVVEVATAIITKEIGASEATAKHTVAVVSESIISRSTVTIVISKSAVVVSSAECAIAPKPTKNAVLHAS